MVKEKRIRIDTHYNHTMVKERRTRIDTQYNHTMVKEREYVLIHIIITQWSKKREYVLIHIIIKTIKQHKLHYKLKECFGLVFVITKLTCKLCANFF